MFPGHWPRWPRLLETLLPCKVKKHTHILQLQNISTMINLREWQFSSEVVNMNRKHRMHIMQYGYRCRECTECKMVHFRLLLNWYFRRLCCARGAPHRSLQDSLASSTPLSSFKSYVTLSPYGLAFQRNWQLVLWSPCFRQRFPELLLRQLI